LPPSRCKADDPKELSKSRNCLESDFVQKVTPGHSFFKYS
jgi:hypothetical protein